MKQKSIREQQLEISYEQIRDSFQQLQLEFGQLRKRSKNERSQCIRKDQIHKKKVSQGSSNNMKGKPNIRAMLCKSKHSVKINNRKQLCQNNVSGTLKGQMKILKTKFSVGMQKSLDIHPIFWSSIVTSSHLDFQSLKYILK
ncbi:unnamed protein product [Paramecium pentaurelia]|uniref:Uncharacterized protein n=1 Tax=Paramecium pentaurelia TaxID=43138 RepID=A0A8S1TDK1_9CILI|nr:unnamed protein product [Paramecium pentaurelia]